MDVRGVDASILAAKRIEFEKVAPVTQKPKRLGDDRVATQGVGDEDNRGSTADSVVDEEHGGQSDEYYPREENESEATATPEVGDAEHHILDVRV